MSINTVAPDHTERLLAPTKVSSIERPSTSSKAVSTERPRIQLDFTPEAFEQLNRMKERSKSRSTAELTRNALRFYDWFLEKQQQGYELLLAKEGEVKQVELLL